MSLSSLVQSSPNQLFTSDQSLISPTSEDTNSINLMPTNLESPEKQKYTDSVTPIPTNKLESNSITPSVGSMPPPPGNQSSTPSVIYNPLVNHNRPKDKRESQNISASYSRQPTDSDSHTGNTGNKMPKNLNDDLSIESSESSYIRGDRRSVHPTTAYATGRDSVQQGQRGRQVPVSVEQISNIDSSSKTDSIKSRHGSTNQTPSNRGASKGGTNSINGPNSSFSNSVVKTPSVKQQIPTHQVNGSDVPLRQNTQHKPMADWSPQSSDSFQPSRQPNARSDSFQQSQQFQQTNARAELFKPSRQSNFVPSGSESFQSTTQAGSLNGAVDWNTSDSKSYFVPQGNRSGHLSYTAGIGQISDLSTQTSDSFRPGVPVSFRDGHHGGNRPHTLASSEAFSFPHSGLGVETAYQNQQRYRRDAGTLPLSGVESMYTQMNSSVGYSSDDGGEDGVSEQRDYGRQGEYTRHEEGRVSAESYCDETKRGGCDDWEYHRVAGSWHEESDKNLYEVLKGEPELSKFVKTIKIFPDIVKALKRAPNLTILAPPNEYWRKVKDLGPWQMRQLILYHIISQRLPIVTFENNKMVSSLDKNLRVRCNVYTEPTFRNLYVLNGQDVIRPNLWACNGLVHIIRGVLCPPIENILDFINLLAPLGLIQQLVSTSPQILNTLLTYPNLTLLAPTNDAFNRYLLDRNLQLSQVMSNPNLITVLLKEHIIDQIIVTSALQGRQTFGILTANGTPITFDGTNDHVVIIDSTNGAARIIHPNIFTSNGVIQVIDYVLQPPQACLANVM